MENGVFSSNIKCAIASFEVIGSVVMPTRPTVILKLSKIVLDGIIGILKVLIASSVRYSEVLKIKTPELPKSLIDTHFISFESVENQ